LSSGLILILVITGAYLAAHAAIEWLGEKFMLISGAEYLLLGILLGPQVSGLIRATVVESFAPFLTLAIGWAGAMIGTQLHLPTLMRTRGIFYRVAFTESLLCLAFVAAMMTAVFTFLFGADVGQTLIPALALGAIATASSPLGVALVASRMERRAAILRQLQATNLVDAVVAIVAFSILLCIAHPIPLDIRRPPTATEWAVISVGIGVIGGILFHLFIEREHNPDRLFIAMTGAIILASGAAAYLRLSPLLPSMLIGAILVNTSRYPKEIPDLVAKVARSMYFVLLIFAGAAWQPSSHSAWLIAAGAFLLLRFIGKLGSARLAARMSQRYQTLGPNWGRALLGHGGLAVAIALNYLLHDTSALPNVVFTATVASVLLTEFASARVVQSVVKEYVDRVMLRAPAVPEAETGH
jgi:hypothetical protein